MSYEVTKSRVLQWIGIILIIGVFAGAYWYFKVYGSTLNASQNDLNTNGLVGLWSFNGDDISSTTAYDRSGSGNNGTLTNGPTVTQGKVGQALNFDGTDDYVAATGPVVTGEASVFAWIKPTSVSTWQGIIGDVTGGDTPGMYNLEIGRDSGKINATWNGSFTNFCPGSQTLSAGLWYHVGFVRSGSSGNWTCKLYVNGVLDNTTTGITYNPSNSLNFTMGKTGTKIFGGSLDEPRIYNRALSAGEVQSLYAQGGGTKVDSAVSQPQGTGRLDSGLAGYWKMDDGSGTSATDSSTNGNTGTLVSSPTWTTGQIDGALNFSGSYVSVSDVASLDITGTIALSAWINKTSHPAAGNFHQIFAKGLGAAAEWNYRMGTYGASGTEYLSFGFYSGGDHIIRGTTTAIDLNTWYHVVALYNDSTNSIELYVNGVLQGESVLFGSPETSSIIANNRALNIGTSDSTANFFVGKIDEARLYNRILSADEVAQLYRLNTPTIVDTGLKGYWSFNGKDMSGTTAYDRSGAGNTGTLTNGPATAEGKLGQALDLDGTDDYVSVADSASLDIGDTDDLTLSGWFYRDTFTTDDTIIAKRNGIANTDDGYILYIDDATDKLTFEVSEASGTDEYQLESISTFTSTGWNHYAIVWDQDSAANSEIYVNGVANGATDTGTIGNLGDLSNAVVLAAGAESDAGNPFDGKLDETRVYKRALSVGEIKGLYDVGEVDKTNSSVSQAQGTGRLDSGLAGYWPLDNGSGTSATDASTNGNTGTLTNGPTWTTGQVGGAVDFDGTDDSVNIGTDSSLVFTTVETVSAWVYIDVIPTPGSTGMVFYKYSSGDSGFYYGLGIYNSSSSAKVRLSTGGGGANNDSTGALSIGQWHHIAVTFNRPTVLLYIDGKLDSTRTDTVSSFSSGSGTARIGGITGSYFNGKIDEMRVYNRALSADEVAQLYRLNAPTGTDTGLKGYWSFNGKDMSGTTAYDRSGAGNTGTLTNGPAITEGKIGQGLSFDGTDDYVNLGAGVSLGTLSPMSLSTWVRVESSSTNQTLMGKITAGAITRFSLVSIWGAPAGRISFTADFNGTDIRRESGGGALVRDTWQHVVITWDGSTSASNIHMYVNGTEVSSYSTTTDGVGSRVDDSATNLVLASSNGQGSYLTGKLDEVRVYNRVLSVAEVKSLYNSSR